MIRVAFVLHAMQVAGAEVLVRETIHRLAGRIAPTVFCLDAIGTIGEQLRAEGVPVVCFHRRQPGRDWGLAWRMAREISGRKIDVLHAHQYTPFFYAALARVFSGAGPRVILTEHGRHYPDVVSPLRRAANRLLFDRLADTVNAVCRFSSRSLAAVDGFAAQRIAVIENGIDLAQYEPAKDRGELRRRLGLRPERRYVANVARLHPIKDQATLLRAFAAVASALSDVDLVIVGDGPLRQELEKLADQLGLAGRVHWFGVRADVPDILRAVDAFALTSLCEAASLTLLEAMAAGLPVVVTAVGGNPEIVRHGREGLLVPRGDAKAIAEAVCWLLDHPALAAAQGAAGRVRVEERYQLARTVRSYDALYQSLSARPALRSSPNIGSEAMAEEQPEAGNGSLSVSHSPHRGPKPNQTPAAADFPRVPNRGRQPGTRRGKELFKSLLRHVAGLCVIPCLLSYRLRAALIGADVALEGSSQALALIPGLLGDNLRRAFYGRVLSGCHHTATVSFGTLFSKAQARIDENVYIGPRCHFGLVHVERDVLIAPAVHVTSGPHSHGMADPTVPMRLQPGAPQCVRIGAGAWIGSAAVVMADVGRNTIVGAGAVVTHPLPEGVIAAGVPARVLRRRGETEGNRSA